MRFIKLHDNSWWELIEEKLMVFNYDGGHHYITNQILASSQIFECDDWHALYLSKHYCSLESQKFRRNGWISPEGIFYEAESHEVTAEHICEIIFGFESQFAGDELENRGWIRVTTSLMWEVRDDYFKDKELTQKQLDVLYDWCLQYNKTFPYSEEVL